MRASALAPLFLAFAQRGFRIKPTHNQSSVRARQRSSSSAALLLCCSAACSASSRLILAFSKPHVGCRLLRISNIYTAFVGSECQQTICIYLPCSGKIFIDQTTRAPYLTLPYLTLPYLSLPRSSKISIDQTTRALGARLSTRSSRKFSRRWRSSRKSSRR